MKKIFCDVLAVSFDRKQQKGDKDGKIYYRGDNFRVPGVFV